MNPELPVVLSSLFDNSLADADYPTLLKKSEEAFELLQVTKKQQELVEEKTREQASSRLWFRMRTGRITASKFKNAKYHIFCTSLCGDILDFQIFLLFITGKLEILKEIATAKKELPKFYRTWAFLL